MSFPPRLGIPNTKQGLEVAPIPRCRAPAASAGRQGLVAVCCFAQEKQLFKVLAWDCW